MTTNPNNIHKQQPSVMAMRTTRARTTAMRTTTTTAATAKTDVTTEKEP